MVADELPPRPPEPAECIRRSLTPASHPSLRPLVVELAVEQGAGGLRAGSAPLFEPERHASFPALPLDAPNPRRVHQPCTRPRLSAHHHPINQALPLHACIGWRPRRDEVLQVEVAKQGFAGQEPHRSRNLAQDVGAIPVLGSSSVVPNRRFAKRSSALGSDALTLWVLRQKSTT
jgi:hypothetical protein